MSQCHSSGVARARLCFVGRGECFISISPPRVPPSFIPQIQRSEPKGLLPTPFRGRVQSQSPAGDFTGPGLVRLHAAQPCLPPSCSTPSLSLSSPEAPQPSPPASPLSANLSPSQDEPWASASPSVLHLWTYREASVLPTASHLTLVKRSRDGLCYWPPGPSLSQSSPLPDLKPYSPS